MKIEENSDNMTTIEDLLEEVADPITATYLDLFEKDQKCTVPEHVTVWEVEGWRLDRYMEEVYDDFLDETEKVTLLGGAYSFSSLLKDADEVCYDQGKSEYIDGQLPFTIDDCFSWKYNSEFIAPIDMEKLRRIVLEVGEFEDDCEEVRIVKNAAYKAISDAGERRTGHIGYYKTLLFQNTITDEYFTTLQEAIEASREDDSDEDSEDESEDESEEDAE